MTDEFSFILAPSKIHGIGVFATQSIKKGIKLRLFPNSDKVRLFKKIGRHKDFLDRYCVESKEGYHGPADFGRMSIGWYLNHSKHPNAAHKNYHYISVKDIKQGDEITIDYETL